MYHLFHDLDILYDTLDSYHYGNVDKELQQLVRVATLRFHVHETLGLYFVSSPFVQFISKCNNAYRH